MSQDKNISNTNLREQKKRGIVLLVSRGLHPVVLNVFDYGW